MSTFCWDTSPRTTSAFHSLSCIGIPKQERTSQICPHEWIHWCGFLTGGIPEMCWEVLSHPAHGSSSLPGSPPESTGEHLEWEKSSVSRALQCPGCREMQDFTIPRVGICLWTRFWLTWDALKSSPALLPLPRGAVWKCAQGHPATLATAGHLIK